MPAFKRFGPDDQIDNVLILEPRYDLASGTGGWRGSPNGSSSISLYGGARRSSADVFADITYQSHAPNVGQTGNPRLGQPMTASINYVEATSEELNFSSVGNTRWGREHWNTINRLYDDYRALDPDYVTASYDRYTVFFQKDSSNIVALTGGLVPGSYPGTSAAMAAVVGFGTWTHGWLLDESSGSLSSSFAPVSPLPLQVDTSVIGTASYGAPGPLNGTDRAIGFDPTALTARFDGGANFNVPVGSDLLFAIVGRWTSIPSNATAGSIVGKIQSNGQGWSVHKSPSGYLFQVFDGVNSRGAGIGLGSYFPGDWHVAMGGIDRASGQIRLGVRSLTTGRTFISPSNSGIWNIPGSSALTSSTNFFMGANPNSIAADANFQMAALYLSTGSAVATGTLDDSHFSLALANLANSIGSYTPASLTSSFVIESWIKPFVGSLAPRPFTIQSRNGSFWFGMTGTLGRLLFSGSNGSSVTSSVSPDLTCWNHVAVSYDATSYSGSLYLNMNQVGSFSMTPLTASAATTLHTIGNATLGSGTVVESFLTTGTVGLSFHGLIGESRVWDSYRSYAQLSSTFLSRITGSGLLGPQMSLPFSDGPLSRVFTYPRGSGTMDHARYVRGAAYQFAGLQGFNDRSGPVWQPSDNPIFITPKLLAPAFVPANSTVESTSLLRGDDVSRLIVIDVPSAFYGRNIVPGSVVMTDRSYSNSSYGFVRTLVDDGRGGLYISGSLASGSVPSLFDSNADVTWNKVGNVFYGEGLIVIKDPSMLDFGRIDGGSAHPNDTFQLTFKGQSRIPVKTLMCRIDHGEFNCTTNPTFSVTGSAGELLRRHASGSLRVSTVGVYNSDRELVAVARLADPVRIRARDRLNIKLRVDF